jgi:hypothetical protein
VGTRHVLTRDACQTQDQQDGIEVIPREKISVFQKRNEHVAGLIRAARLGALTIVPT